MLSATTKKHSLLISLCLFGKTDATVAPEAKFKFTKHRSRGSLKTDMSSCWYYCHFFFFLHKSSTRFMRCCFGFEPHNNKGDVSPNTTFHPDIKEPFFSFFIYTTSTSY